MLQTVNCLRCRWSATLSKWPCIFILASLAPSPTSAQTILTEGTNLAADVSPVDGRIAFDLLGSVWILPEGGGQAEELPNTILPARWPRWSPSGQLLLYQSASASGSQLWLHDLKTGQPQRLSNNVYSDQQASWHPDGERIVFSSAANQQSLDLWEIDIATGLRWRLSNNAGDETEPTWSADGRNLAYIAHDANGWSLVLREHGEPDRQLLHSERRLLAPSWRPDGSLITFLRESGDGYSLDMVILSDPPLIRKFSDTEEDFFASRVSWRNRNQMIYSADGKLLARDFNRRRARPIRFRATISRSMTRSTRNVAPRHLPIITPPAQKLVIRASRLFDGVQHGYQRNIDVVVDGATISAVETRRNWPDATILDLGDVTILPGFIDLYSTLPHGVDAGASLLAYGVTTVVSNESIDSRLVDTWHSEDNPGPRVIPAGNITLNGNTNDSNFYLAIIPADTSLEQGPRRAVRHWQELGVPVLAENWTVGLGLGADLLLGADSLPKSPLGRQYQDMQAAISNGPVLLVSGLADANTPGLEQLLSSRQAMRFSGQGATVRQQRNMPPLHSEASSIVLGSKPNGLPPGLSLHAELRALTAAGLSGEQALRAAGTNIGRTLGLEQQIGRVVPGALADLVLVSGDPLMSIADALKIVAVVRNGRFFSLIRLLEGPTPGRNSHASSKGVD